MQTEACDAQLCAGSRASEWFLFLLISHLCWVWMQVLHAALANRVPVSLETVDQKTKFVF